MIDGRGGPGGGRPLGPPLEAGRLGSAFNRESCSLLVFTPPTTSPEACGSAARHGTAAPMNPDEKRIAAKQCLEAKYTRVNKLKEDREMRKQNLRAKMEEMQLDPEKQQEAEALHDRNETEHLRAQRLKLTVQDFDQLDIIGRGAFGEVRLCREKTSSNVYAMKKLRKAEMVLKGQVQHVHAELEVMSDSDETNEWVVKLHYSFQDEEFLYLVMNALHPCPYP